MIKRINVALFFYLISALSAYADGIVSSITSAPVAPNGIVVNERAALNVHLQRDGALGLAFMDPAVEGYGIPENGSIEIEMVSGFQRDPAIPLDEKALILVVGAPQQGLPAKPLELAISEGNNENTFKITSKDGKERLANDLRSPAKGSASDPIPQRGIKIIHIGRNAAFVSRGKEGQVAVRIKNSAGEVVANGSSKITFLETPRPQIFLTNVTHNQRNHNWQRIGRGKTVGANDETLPLAFMLYAKNKGLETIGLERVGVLSVQQLAGIGLRIPEKLSRFNAGLILQDSNGDGMLDPRDDLVVGGMNISGPGNFAKQQIVSPIANEKPFLSAHTSNFHPRAGKQIGGAVMQVVYVAGDVPGVYELAFTLFEKPGDVNSPDGSVATYSVVVE